MGVPGEEIEKSRKSIQINSAQKVLNLFKRLMCTAKKLNGVQVEGAPQADT
jgi:hypothetical protein